MRSRWKDPSGTIYEWDSENGAVEKYSPDGTHLGEFDHITGERTKEANPARSVER